MGSERGKLARGGGKRDSSDMALTCPSPRSLFRRAPSRRVRAGMRSVVSLLTWLVVGLTGTGCNDISFWDDNLCQPGLCPSGMRCEPSTGQCVAETTAGGSGPSFHGRFSVVAGGVGAATDPRWWLGYDPARQSLGLWDGTTLRYLDGPAADRGGGPAGQNAALIRDPRGGLIAAWLRASDGSIWCAWSRLDWVPVEVVSAGASAPLALAADSSSVWLASRDNVARTVALSELAHPVDRRTVGNWKRSLLASPMGMGEAPGVPVDLGRWLALTATASGPVLAAYEAVGGDLVLATRSEGLWQANRIAGRDRLTGLDTTDAGQAVALAVAPGGALLVAWRDRSTDQVVLLRDQSGVTSTQIVGSGLHTDSQTATERSALYGSQIALAALPDGRAVLAVAEGMRWYVDVAHERPDGSFAHTALTAAEVGGPLAFPALDVRGANAVAVHALRIRAESGPAANRMETTLLQLTTGGP